MCYFHSGWMTTLFISQFPWPEQFQLPRLQALSPAATTQQSAGPEKSLWVQCLLRDMHTYCTTLMENCKFYLRLSNISVIPALSASSSILNLASSWSSFLKCRSTCFKEDQR